MLMTSNRKIMGNRVNSRGMNVLGPVMTGPIFLATVGLVVSWLSESDGRGRPAPAIVYR
jgi:Mn2+/Fe2+ NRAMP family transporter